MLFCGVVENLPRWPWDNKRYTKRPPRLRQVYTRMSGAFFHKGISRFQAEMYLTKSKDDGSFLVRDSESLTGAYVLCVLHEFKVHQYRVIPGPDGKLHVQSETGTIQRGYADLIELIADYVKKGDQNGLCCALVHPVPPEGSSEDYISEEDDDDDDEDFESPPPVMSPPATPSQRKSLGPKETEKIDLLKNFSKLDLTMVDPQFGNLLKDYVEHGLQKDATALNMCESEPQEFSKLLQASASGLKRELDSFMMKMEMLNNFLSIGEKKLHSTDTKNRLSSTGMPALLEQLTIARTDMLHLQTKAQESIQLASMPSEYDFVPQPEEGIYNDIATAGPFLSAMYRPCIPQSKFEVRKPKRNNKVTLTVDLQNGKYVALKQVSKDNLSQKVVPQEKIMHLIKNTKNSSTLDIILEGSKKKTTYEFLDAHARESFCLQIRQMKNMHSTETEIEQISLFVGTWNMGDTSPVHSLSTWLKCSGAGKSRDRVFGVIPHDVYVVGTQESTMTEKDWVNTLKAGLKACVLVDMELVEVCTLWGIRLAVLIKPEYKQCISRIQRSYVRTGIANALGNKGAVAISFFFNGTSFCFINAHLTSGDERCARRNQNYRDIIKGLTMSLGQKHLHNFDISNQFHHVFWLGDLNYRVEENIQILLKKVQENDLKFLLQRDQLRKAQKQKVAFCGYDEADITFLPTYRLERNIPGYKYSWKKIKRSGERINAPSWCDRVLWRSYPGVFIENVAYGCSEAILSSDHRPVFSSFNVGISSEFVQSRGSLSDMAAVKIVFHSIEAQVKTCCKQYFQIMFHSTCLQEVYRSQANTSFQDNRVGFYTVPVWQACNIPEMKPLFGDQDFLEEQHILITVILKDEVNESYGECVLSLKDRFSNEPQEFEYILLHQGEETGTLKGKMHITAQKKRSTSKKSTYSLITFDTEYLDPEVFVPDHPNLESQRSVPAKSPIGVSSKFGTGHSFVSRSGTSNMKTPLRNAMSTSGNQFTGTDSEFRRELLSTKLDFRAPQPLPIPGSQPSVPARKSPLMGQAGLQQNAAQRAGTAPPPTASRQRSVPVGLGPPPPVPPKQRGGTISGDHQKSCNSRQHPTTVSDWLAQINLSCYESNFINNGWENLDFLSEMTNDDLCGIEVNVADHRVKILASIKELNRV